MSETEDVTVKRLQARIKLLEIENRALRLMIKDIKDKDENKEKERE